MFKVSSKDSMYLEFEVIWRVFLGSCRARKADTLLFQQTGRVEVSVERCRNTSRPTFWQLLPFLDLLQFLELLQGCIFQPTKLT